MAREIYNEGRVTGLSAYEIYVKQHIAEDPDTAPATEKEWLASSLAMGSSMILKIPTVNVPSGKDHTMLDIPLPHGADWCSNLAAANTIVATLFDGEAEFPEADSDYPYNHYWATRVSSYGKLLYNSAAVSPTEGYNGPDADIRPDDINHVDLDIGSDVLNYVRLVDGIVIQPGTWFKTDASVDRKPEKDFSPDLSYTYPRVRLHVRGKIDRSFLVLLTGFTLNSVLAGTTGTDGSTKTTHPENGDFLGPADFPWATKIVFSVPNAYINYIKSNRYDRAFDYQSGSIIYTSRVDVKDAPVIDMHECNPSTFYENYADGTTDYYKYYDDASGEPRREFKVYDVVSPIQGDTAVLTVFRRSSLFPPALFGTFVTADGNTYLNPLDVVAPGTVKMFQQQKDGQGNPDPTATKELMQLYESSYPGTHALSMTSDGHIQFVYNNSLVTIGNASDSSVAEIRLTNNSGKFTAPQGDLTSTSGTGGTDERPGLLKVTSSNLSGLALLFSDDVSANPNKKTISKSPSADSLINSNSNDNISWASLIYAFTKNRSIDILGDRLKLLKYCLKKPIYNNAHPVDTDPYNSDYGRSYIPFGVNVLEKMYLGHAVPYTTTATERSYAFVNNNTYNNGAYVLKNIGTTESPIMRWNLAMSDRVHTTTISYGNPSQWCCRDIYMKQGFLAVFRGDTPEQDTTQYTQVALVAFYDQWGGVQVLHSLNPNGSTRQPNDGDVIARTISVKNGTIRNLRYIRVQNKSLTSHFDILAVGSFGTPDTNSYTSSEPYYQRPASDEYYIDK